MGVARVTRNVSVSDLLGSLVEQHQQANRVLQACGGPAVKSSQITVSPQPRTARFGSVKPEVWPTVLNSPRPRQGIVHVQPELQVPDLAPRQPFGSVTQDLVDGI